MSGWSALHSAAQAGFDAIVKMLAEAGADLNAQDRGGRTPLDFAVFSKH